ncbi:MAG: glycosyl hydrolase [Saprospiraceae bacterium]|nr:glycosyl hydrolase [Saprospiraceae bacterium]
MKKLLRSFGLLATLSFAMCVTAQAPRAVVPAANPVQPTSAVERMKGAEMRERMRGNSLFQSVKFREVGPTIQSGRIVDVDVSPKDPSVFYACYASGGLWKTASNGTEFTPIFDREAVMTIGDVAVNWDKNIIWLGTGENNSSRSSYAGVGMYKSTNDGKTWEHLGLAETQHIGRIALHPTDANTVFVAALGHLYSPNKERGIFKTSDGGKTWRNTLFVDENTGAIDVALDPTDPSVIYAAMWSKERRAWKFDGSGATSGIYKSTDGGETWALMTNATSGFPTGADAGRIGLTLGQKNGKTVAFAVIDNQGSKPKKDEKTEVEEGLKKELFKTITKEDFLKLDKKQLTNYLKANDFSGKLKVDNLFDLIKSDKIKPVALFDFVDAGDDGFSNSNGIKGAEVYRSDDAGKTWTKTHEGSVDDLFFTYGYYFSQIRVHPTNPDKLYVLGYHAVTSNDGGKTWKNIDKANVHADHHALWINPNRAGHILNGNDGGLNLSYDDGKTWFKLNSPPVGQFYHVNVDMAEPYNVYGGLQDNGVWFGSSKAEPNVDWQDSGQNEFRRIMGGDGMQTMIDTRDNTTVYTGYQFGASFRMNTKSAAGRPKFITPKHELGEKPLRFNWQTPLWLSVHNKDVLYFGANKLYRSFDKGDNWEAISDDLTRGKKAGNVPYGTLATIHESPLKFGLLYAGSDDGLIHVSKDGGNSWKNISNSLPKNLWVSRVQASAHNKATVYAALNGYRWDDFNAYLYVSNNYGETWERIGTDLPAEPINVVKEDPKNAQLIYVGTDHGLYISIDKGRSFNVMDNNLPAVSVHDVVVHPRDKELIVGTHGRSMLIADVQHIQQLDNQTLAKDFALFDVKKMRQTNWGAKRSVWQEMKPVNAIIPIYAKANSTANISIKAGKELILKSIKTELKRGLNYIDFEMIYDEKQTPQYGTFLNEKKEKDAKTIELKKADDGKFYLQKGKYTLEVEQNGVKIEKELIVE